MIIYSFTSLQNKPSQKTPLCSLDVVYSKGLVKLAYPRCNEYFDVNGEWPASNEPEVHLDDIAITIKDVCTFKSILCFSYKDHSLANRLAGHDPLCTVDTLSGRDGLTSLSPEHLTGTSISSVSSIKTTFDLIIIRHFLEHTSDPSALIKSLLELLKPGGSIYIEIPIIDQYIIQGNPLFLWEQHRVYFTAKSFLSFASNHVGPNSLHRIYGNDIEPCSCILVQKPTVSANRVDTILPQFGSESDSGCQLSSISDITIRYIYAWTRYMNSYTGKVAVFGAGHAAHRFIQITKSQNRINHLVDGDKRKCGLYLPGLFQPICHVTDINLNSIGVFLLGVHARDSAKVGKMLRKRGFAGDILSIYELP
jgi:SAM-dependent methyltransferase